MKKIALFIPLLTGCYLANGSPSSTDYWVKNGKQITYNEILNCDKKVYPSLGDRFEYLHHKLKYKSPNDYKEEYSEYSMYFNKARPLVSKCYFDLGYKFTTPYYWCIAESNMETCKINQKYR